jgi:hypothetical protein
MNDCIDCFLEMITERFFSRKNLKRKKEKEHSFATNFFNLNKHRLKEQFARIIFIIPQSTAKAYIPLW